MLPQQNTWVAWCSVGRDWALPQVSRVAGFVVAQLARSRACRTARAHGVSDCGSTG